MVMDAHWTTVNLSIALQGTVSVLIHPMHIVTPGPFPACSGPMYVVALFHSAKVFMREGCSFGTEFKLLALINATCHITLVLVQSGCGQVIVAIWK